MTPDPELEAQGSPAKVESGQKSITNFFKKASKVVEQEGGKIAVQSEDLQEVLTDPTPEEASTPQPLESAKHSDPASVEEEVPAPKPAKKGRKNRTNAQRRAAKERAKQAALEPSVRTQGMGVNALCLVWVVVAIFAGCTVAGVAGWFIEA